MRTEKVRDLRALRRSIMEPIRISHQKGPYRIEAEVLQVGDDLVVSIWGGDRPHVGALALAIPRPSLRNPALISSTASVLARLGHKDNDIVKRVSERISGTLNTVVAVAAGMHWDQIPEEDIQVVAVACDELVDNLIRELQMREE
jgi:hypothetical protein